MCDPLGEAAHRTLFPPLMPSAFCFPQIPFTFHLSMSNCQESARICYQNLVIAIRISMWSKEYYPLKLIFINGVFGFHFFINELFGLSLIA